MNGRHRTQTDQTGRAYASYEREDLAHMIHDRKEDVGGKVVPSKVNAVNLRDIQAFIAVAETGSINRAATRLHLTQPATTRRLQNFEATIGNVVLLDRSMKPPVLTPAGSQVLEHCRHVMKAVVELGDYTANMGEPAGDLHIGVAFGLDEFVMTAPLDDIRRRFPKVGLQVSSNWTTQLIEGVRTGALDCAFGFVASQSIPGTIHARPIAKEHIVVVAARNAMPDDGGGSLSLRSVADKSWVISPPGCGCRSALQRAFDDAKLPMRIAAEIFGDELQLSFIARSGSLGFMPQRFFENSPHRSQLRTVKVVELSLDVTITMLYRPSLGNLAGALDQLYAGISERLNGHEEGGLSEMSS